MDKKGDHSGEISKCTCCLNWLYRMLKGLNLIRVDLLNIFAVKRESQLLLAHAACTGFQEYGESYNICKTKNLYNKVYITDFYLDKVDFTAS
jgi:hypothetical protein